ncbi:hypothetical protein D1007_27265 [Hordeum vulgare]|nr:hypothetical protein D1007_27265 [Hordeum vulgare]
MEQMMKAREELTMKTLETKILITEKKKEVKLAQVEAKREEAKRKADLEERMIKVKEAKVWKKTHGGREGAHDDVQEGHGSRTIAMVEGLQGGHRREEEDIPWCVLYSLR